MIRSIRRVLLAAGSWPLGPNLLQSSPNAPLWRDLPRQWRWPRFAYESVDQPIPYRLTVKCGRALAHTEAALARFCIAPPLSGRALNAAAGNLYPEIPAHCLNNGIGQLASPRRRTQQSFVLPNRDVPQLQQHRGDVERLEDAEPGKPVRMLVHLGDIAELVDQCLCESHRMVLGLALGEVDQDACDLIAFAGEIDACNDVGLVFATGEIGRLAVRSPF